MPALLQLRIGPLAAVTIGVWFLGPPGALSPATTIRGALGLSQPQRSGGAGPRHDEPPTSKDGSLKGRREVLKQASASFASWALAPPEGVRADVSPVTTTTATATDSKLPSSAARSSPSPPVVQRAYRVIPDAGASLNPRLVPIAEAAFYREVVPAAATWPPRMGREASRSGESGGALWLGEHHNSAKDHALQAALIRRLAQDPRREGPVGIGLEQVQVQFQPVLDAYLRREIKMEEMRQQVEWDRRWVWPFENYRSIFEAARELGAPLVALNVNSEDMTAVERQGFAGLSRRKIDQYIPDASGFAEFAARRSFSAYVEYVIQPSYALHRAMGLLEHTMTGEKLEEEMPFRDFLSGRLLWDEAMASRAYSWTRANPNGLLIGLVGADHVKFGAGIPGRYARMAARTGGATNDRVRCTSVLLNPTLIDSRPPGSVTGAVAPEAYSPNHPERLTLQLRFLREGVDGDSADRYLPSSTGGVLPLADYILIGG